MTTFNSSVAFAPTSQTFDPPNRPDALAESVLASLSRPKFGYRNRPWGAIKTAIFSWLTVGILPLLIWPGRFRRLVQTEQYQYWQLAEWLRVRSGDVRAVALRDETGARFRPHGLFSFAPILMGVLTGLLLVRLVAWPFFEFPMFQQVFYNWPNYDWPRRTVEFGFWGRHYSDFWRQWTILLSAGYFAHWLQVCRHTGAVRQYAAKFNAIVASEGITPVKVRGVGLGFHPIWALLAIAGLMRGSFWVVPMVLAGVVHARYVRVTSRQVRSDFARRVKAMLLGNRPPLDVRTTPTVAAGATCLNTKCKAPLREGVAFCPRCGAKAGIV